MRKSFTLALAGIVALGAALSLTRCGGDDPIPADKAVSVSAQQGAVTAGTAGEAVFAVTTANIADGQGGTVTWYTAADGTTAASAPAGITPAVTDVASDAAEVTMTATTAAQEGTYYFKVTIDGAVSNTAELKVSAQEESNELNGTTWLAIQSRDWVEPGAICTMTLEFTSDTAVNLTVASGDTADIPDGTYNGTYTYTPPTVLFDFGETEFPADLEIAGNTMGGDGDDPLFIKQTGGASQEYHVIVVDFIIFDENGHGLIYGSAKADKATATAGRTVSLNATPDSEEYVFYKWTVLMGGITLSPDAYAHTATFTMPPSAVVVKTEFKAGITIGGITWATCNVDMPGTFAAKPGDFGMFYKWGKNVGWSSTDPLINSDGGTTWDSTIYSGAEWPSENDPCPEGWRVPALSDFEALCNEDAVSNKWTGQDGVYGRLFTDTATGNSIFLPATGSRLNGFLSNQGASGHYWSSTPHAGAMIYYLNINSTRSATSYTYSGSAYAVRCVKGETNKPADTMTLTTTII